ncbi:hypothetical protein [Chitinophaga varians]|uniref:hypothetical protein n=1 Tax=Chitinophaga varians TaxID=2202339 RepID=UPI00165EF08C|nr:hypothetical protein [Chitinophaga varians]MBC9909484.1 hypothetical protein [Chitinophaga varians]
MKRVWFYMTVYAVIAGSCGSKKSDDITPVFPPSPEWRLSETVIRYAYGNNPLIKPGVTDSIITTYNPDKTFHTQEQFRGPRANSGATYYLYTALYDQQQVAKITYQHSKTGTPEIVNETRYVNHQLVRFFKPGLETTRYDSVVYENNKIVKVIHIDDPVSMSRKWEYAWEHDNLKEVKYYVYAPNEGWKDISVTRYDYTDIANMLKSAAPCFLLWGGAPDASTFSANALRSTTTFATDGKILYTYTLSYTLDENNLPATDSLWYTDAVAGTRQLYSVSRSKYIDLNKK